ncbi:glyoxalase-like protein [Rhodovulum imhoffii]|uniref:Glyoxalase-like protein n=1 Tax=Rhodovulum imhoffii TaxID=365340 RepID=A0A2T5BW63_9RHOB|nr:VOC family protein [Rhodovulum imhoffii]MBK5935156.1 polyphosphate kinase [Rhodovulum imhoffii]PTN03877.1 glyoxalase-like protein [Rhodovulum imhoffii]
MLELDHLVVSAKTLDEGVRAVERTLGVRMAPGGAHPAMGTHNRLLHLGAGLYLEVIAVDPEAKAPPRRRWFGLDGFGEKARLTHWVARSDDLSSTLGAAPDGSGALMDLTRGELSWQMAVPEDGTVPFGGAFPALIGWQGAEHPSSRLPDCGCRLLGLDIQHPQASALAGALAGLIDDPRIAVQPGPAPRLSAMIETPSGRKILA